MHRSAHLASAALVFALTLGPVVLCQRSFAEGDQAKSEAKETKPAADAAKAEEGKAEEAKPDEKKVAKKRKSAVRNGQGLGILGGLIQELVVGGNDPAQVGPMEDNRPEEERLKDPAVVQFVHANRNRLLAELRFVRLICDQLQPDQRHQIREAGETGLKQYALQFAAQQRQMQRGVANVVPSIDAGQLIRQAIISKLETILPNDKFMEFKAESVQRMEIRKRAILMNVVSLLDSKLLLEQDQRERILASLTSRWVDSWEKWSMLNMYGGRYLPMIPDDCVTNVLTSEQKKIWVGIQKVDFSWWNVQMNEVAQADDQWWGFEQNQNNEPENIIF